MNVVAMNLPEVDGVEYVVSWQQHEDAPIPGKLQSRHDIKIYRFEQKGLSNNRNNALMKATGDICLIADDDLIYTESQLKAVKAAFQNHPEIDLAVFQYTGPYHRKTYPTTELSLVKVPRYFHPVNFEMAFRRKAAFTDRPLRFNLHFGPGAQVLTAGEDDILFLTARRLGLNCRFFPITITTHNDMPTGGRKVTDPGVLRTNGAIIALTHPITFPARLPVNAWRIKKSGRAGFWNALKLMTQGAIYALSNSAIRKSIP